MIATLSAARRSASKALAAEQRLKLQAYSRLEEVISDVSLGQSAVRHEEADVWLGKYQVRRRPLLRMIE